MLLIVGNRSVGSSNRKRPRLVLDRGVIEPVAEGKRSYRLRLAPSELTPLLVRELDRLGFLPRILRDSQ